MKERESERADTQKLTRNAFALWGESRERGEERGIIKESKVDASRE